MLQPGAPLLIIAHTFPPHRGIGGRRWAKFARELARRGHPVHVIHSAGAPGLMGSLWTDDVQHALIHRHPLPQRYPTVLFKRPLTRLSEKLAYRFWSRLMPWLAKGNWYDKAVFWEEQLLRKAMELIRTHGIRTVVVTGAPFRLMAQGAWLKDRIPDLRLVADFRDPWTWGEVYGQSAMSAARKAFEHDMEQQVARTFDRLISPAPAIVEHLRTTYGGDPQRYVLIPHAIDPEEIAATALPRNGSEFRLIYAGSLYGAQEADAYIDAVIAAFDALRTRSAQHFARTTFDLFITGHDVARHRERVAAHGLAERIVFHPPLPPKELFPRIAAADLVMAFIPSFNRDFLGTKFNEVFHLQRPVLHVGEPGLVSRTIVENGMGDSLRVSELSWELPRILTGERTIPFAPKLDVSGYLLPRVTDRLIEEVL